MGRERVTTDCQSCSLEHWTGASRYKTIFGNKLRVCRWCADRWSRRNGYWVMETVHYAYRLKKCDDSHKTAYIIEQVRRHGNITKSVLYSDDIKELLQYADDTCGVI